MSGCEYIQYNFVLQVWSMVRNGGCLVCELLVWRLEFCVSVLKLSWSSHVYFPSAIQRVPLMYTVHFILPLDTDIWFFKIYRHVLQTAILYLKLFLAQCTTFCCSMDFVNYSHYKSPSKLSVVFGFPSPPLYAELVCFILSEN